MGSTEIINSRTTYAVSQCQQTTVPQGEGELRQSSAQPLNDITVCGLRTSIFHEMDMTIKNSLVHDSMDLPAWNLIKASLEPLRGNRDTWFISACFNKNVMHMHTITMRVFFYMLSK